MAADNTFDNPDFVASHMLDDTTKFWASCKRAPHSEVRLTLAPSTRPASLEIVFHNSYRPRTLSVDTSCDDGATWELHAVNVPIQRNLFRLAFKNAGEFEASLVRLTLAGPADYHGIAQCKVYAHRPLARCSNAMVACDHFSDVINPQHVLHLANQPTPLSFALTMSCACNRSCCAT